MPAWWPKPARAWPSHRTAQFHPLGSFMALTEPRYRPADLVSFAEALLVEAGVAADRAPTIAQYLVEADLMGHTTHGLALLGPYIDELAAGRMALQGEPVVIRDTGACLTWDGRRLPGVWLTVAAIDAALERVATYGTVTVVIRRSHHIACLGAFLTRATDRGCMILLACSDPAAASVAPFGGITAVFTPDPLAVGIPTDGEPDPDRHQCLDHHQRHERAPAPAGTAVPARLAAGCGGRAQRRSGRAVHRPTGHAAAGGRAGPRPEGLRHGPAGRGPDPGPGRLRPGRAAGGLGGLGVRAGHRPRGLRRDRGIRARDRLDRRRLPPGHAASRASSGSACRARRRWRAGARPMPRVPPSTRGSWTGSPNGPGCGELRSRSRSEARDSGEVLPNAAPRH